MAKKFRIKEFASEYRLSVSYIYKAITKIKNGEPADLPVFYKTPAGYFFDQDDIDNWIDEKKYNQ